jgi:hypothetical protein
VAEHIVVKPEKIVGTAAGLLEQELVIPNLMHKEGFDKFRGAKDDTVNVTVPGILPFHDYAWRNDRTSGIVFDEYQERKVPVTFGGNVYSAVKVTDEQMEMDLPGWAKLLDPQVRAVGRGLQRRAVNTVVNAPYQVTIGNAQGNLRGALIEARRVLNAFMVPDEQRIVLVGSDFEAAMLDDDKLTLAQNVGDAEAQSALRSATLGEKYGFKFVSDPTLPSDAAFAILPSGYVFISGAPRVPNGASYGATTSYEGIALRWLCDYDTERQQDRSVVNTFAGFDTIKDPLVGYNAGTGQEFVSTSEYFVRGIKLTLDGASDYPAAASELATITGISDASVWTPTGRVAETDPANV